MAKFGQPKLPCHSWARCWRCFSLTPYYLLEPAPTPSAQLPPATAATDGDGAQTAEDGGDEPGWQRMAAEPEQRWTRRRAQVPPPHRRALSPSARALPWEGGASSLARILHPSSLSTARPRSRSVAMGRRHRTSPRRGFRHRSSPPSTSSQRQCCPSQPPHAAACAPATSASTPGHPAPLTIYCCHATGRWEKKRNEREKSAKTLACGAQ
uniref:Uncharacterized protein n=1 Tax=Oryza barthii TaxID=65489 RepID=A0A0D3ENJ1_9ORYZ